jgi:predicted O-linked N-acetylglucosamine transferase (SPINDLY family)
MWSGHGGCLPDTLPGNPRPNGAITFGIFQRPSKLNGRVWDAVSAVMQRVSGSRLLIHQGTRDLDRPDGHTRTQ